MKFRDIILPDELAPSEEMIKSAKEQDEFYKTMYEQLREDNKDAAATNIIGVLAKFRVEQVSLLIGSNLRDRDKEILMDVIAFHIARQVFRG